MNPAEFIAPVEVLIRAAATLMVLVAGEGEDGGGWAVKRKVLAGFRTRLKLGLVG